MILNSKSKEETQKLAEEILHKLEGRNVILLQGELGAGKTTFAQGFLTAAGAKGPFTSPTFVVMKRYKIDKLQITNYKLQINNKEQIKKNKSRRFIKHRSKIVNPICIYHFDCYRVGAEDVLEMGWEEIIKNQNNLVLVEWPEKIEPILPKEYIKLEFESTGENGREIKIIRS